MKNWFIGKDSDYFQDNFDVIELENCPRGGHSCKLQLALMNELLIKARKYIESKEYNAAFLLFEEAFNFSFDIKPIHCQNCTILFRNTILNSMSLAIIDLERMTHGLFAKKKYISDLVYAKTLIEDLKSQIEDDKQRKNQAPIDNEEVKSEPVVEGLQTLLE